MKCECGRKFVGNYCAICGKYKDSLTDSMTTPQVFSAIAVLSIGVIFVLGLLFIPGMMANANTRASCREEVARQLSIAKEEPRSPGVYHFDSETMDAWHHGLSVKLSVDPLNNNVDVTSAGKDGIIATSDDITESGVDVHLRKAIAKGIEEGARSAGRGMTKGIKEGVFGTEEEKAAKEAEKANKPGFLRSIFSKGDANTNG